MNMENFMVMAREGVRMMVMETSIEVIGARRLMDPAEVPAFAQAMAVGLAEAERNGDEDSFLRCISFILKVITLSQLLRGAAGMIEPDQVIAECEDIFAAVEVCFALERA